MRTFSAVATNQAEQTSRTVKNAWPNPFSGVWAWLKYAAGRVFGCWHRRLSMPFTLKSETYRICIDCGARRAFDRTSWKAYGPFYHPVSTTSSLYKTAPVRPVRARTIRIVPSEKELEPELEPAA